LKNYRIKFLFYGGRGVSEATERNFSSIFFNKYLPEINELGGGKTKLKSKTVDKFSVPTKCKKTKKDVFFCVPHEAVKFSSSIDKSKKKKSENFGKSKLKSFSLSETTPGATKHYISNGYDTIQSRIYPFS
jgi:hypothetical protein